MKRIAKLTALLLALALLLAACNGKSAEGKTTGELGDTLKTMFFDFSVDEASSPAEYDGYLPADGNRLVVCTVTVLSCA